MLDEGRTTLVKRRLASLKLWLLLPIVAAVLPFTTLLADKKHSQESPELRISYQTHGVAVLKAEPKGKAVLLSLRNDYKKNIRAFAISPPGQQGHDLHIISDDTDFTPGSIYQHSVSPASD